MNLSILMFQPVQVEVTYEDQQNINAFSKLNAKMHDLEAQVRGQKVRLKYWLVPRLPWLLNHRL